MCNTCVSVFQAKMFVNLIDKLLIFNDIYLWGGVHVTDFKSAASTISPQALIISAIIHKDYVPFYQEIIAGFL